MSQEKLLLMDAASRDLNEAVQILLNGGAEIDATREGDWK